MGLNFRATALRPLAPLVLAAWEDGSLSPGDLLEIRAALERGPGLTEAERALLRSYLDPEKPPSPQALIALERDVHTFLSAVEPRRRHSFSELASALSEPDGPPSEALRSLLSPLETELSTEVLPRTQRTRVAGRREPLSEDVRALIKERLDGPHAATRERVRKALSAPEFRSRDDLTQAEYREQVLSWVKSLSSLGLFERAYGAADPGRRELGHFVSGFETLAFFDLSLVVKFGVQFGLFGGAIGSLGREHHQDVLAAVGRCEMLGCFAMTERAHGSNVRDLETTGVYDPSAREFVIHTPSLGAGKEWIGGAAVHARYAVVFGQLETLGERYGVHAWLMPIRDAQGQTLKGIRVEDCGKKMGLNGVDNGRLWFDHVRVPRTALLDRFGQVAEDGTYTSEIPSAAKRFFTMLGVLVGGRISVAGAALSASKVGLAIAIRYAEERRQFPNGEGEEKPLFEYLTHQRRLIPRLAAACAFSFAQNALVQAFEAAQVDSRKSRDVDRLAAGLKALGTWQAIDTLQQCRECCGGQGYLTSNRIDALRTDTDVFTTFEGDNTVLMQLVAKELLGRYGRALSKHPVRTVAKAIARDVSTRVNERNPLSVRNTDEAALRSPDFHAEALRFREESLLASLARRVNRRVKDGMSAQDAFEACQDHALSLARAHVERFVHGAFREGAKEVPLLEALCGLYGLWRIEGDLAWYLENGYLAPEKSRAVREQINQLVSELRSSALEVSAAFGVPPSCLGPLADPAYLSASGLARG